MFTSVTTRKIIFQRIADLLFKERKNTQLLTLCTIRF